jgi:hypothetical protein
MIDFIAGLALGIFGIIVIALHLGNRAQTKPQQQQHGIVATSISLNGNTDKRTLQDELAIFREQPNGSA